VASNWYEQVGISLDGRAIYKVCWFSN